MLGCTAAEEATEKHQRKREERGQASYEEQSWPLTSGLDFGW